jgi:hypothetical protein
MYHFQEHLKEKKSPKDITINSNIENSKLKNPIEKTEYKVITEKVNRIHFTDQLSKLKNNNKP